MVKESFESSILHRHFRTGKSLKAQLGTISISSEMSERVHITNRESSNPQHNQRKEEDFSMSKTPTYNRALKPKRLLNQTNSGNENEKERPIRQMGNYVRLPYNSSAGTKVRGNVEDNRDWEEQKAHTEYVRLYNSQRLNRA